MGAGSKVRAPEDVRMGPEASIFIVIITALLGAVATAAGIYAHIIKDQTPSALQAGSLGHVVQCAYQRSRVKLVLWVGAGCLCAGQILVSMIGGCVCCCTLLYARGAAHNWSMILFLLSWIFFWAAETCYLSGAYINDYHTSQTIFEYDYDLRKCFKTKNLVYYVGAGCSLVASLMAVLYYGQAQKSKYEAWVEQGAPTPRLYSVKTMKSFVIAGPAKRGPLKEEADSHQEPLLPPLRPGRPNMPKGGVPYRPQNPPPARGEGV